MVTLDLQNAQFYKLTSWFLLTLECKNHIVMVTGSCLHVFKVFFHSLFRFSYYQSIKLPECLS